MPLTQRALASTRGEILSLLCHSPHTVGDLAIALNLTNNAVRAHLAAMERDGIVVHTGVRRGIGKPAFIYEMTPQGQALLSRAYQPALQEVLNALTRTLGPADSESLLRDAGRGLAAQHILPPGDLRTRAEASLAMLQRLGGTAGIEEHDSALRIRSLCCPLSAVVPEHPEVCKLFEAMLTEMIGVPVHEQCDKKAPPSCCFELGGAV